MGRCKTFKFDIDITFLDYHDIDMDRQFAGYRSLIRQRLYHCYAVTTAIRYNGIANRKYSLLLKANVAATTKTTI